MSGGTNGSGGSFRAPFEDRNIYRQTGRKTVDLRVSKVFSVGGTKKVEILAEAFNLFNWVNYTSFTTTKYSIASSSFDAAANMVTINLTPSISSATGLPTFLARTNASNTIYGPRDGQIGLKFVW